MRKFLPLFFIGLLLLCGCSEEDYQYLYENGYDEGYDKCYQDALSDFGMFPEDKLLEYVHDVYSIEDLYGVDYLKTYAEEVFLPEDVYSEDELIDSLPELGYETTILNEKEK